MRFFVLLTKLFLVPSYLYDKCLAFIYKKAMRHCGRNVYLRPSSCDFKGLGNLSIGNGTSIPKGSIIYCTDAPCIIGNKVVFGPRPTIITGNHAVNILGRHIIDITPQDKKHYIESMSLDKDYYDAPVVIEDGCWIGANVTILKGVTIGRGSVVAAGAVVTTSCKPYSIIGGVPAKLIKMRFSEQQIAEHEQFLKVE